MRICDDLRQAVLQAAIQGKLTKQLPEDGNAHTVYNQIKNSHAAIQACNSELAVDSMNFDIPDNWTWAKLNEIFDFVDYRGKTPKKISSGVFLVTASNIRKGFMDYNRKEYISQNEYKERLSRGVTEKGDLLFTTEAPMGNAAICNLDECSCGQRVITMKPFVRHTLLPKLYMYFILSPSFQKQLIDNATGTTAKGIKGVKLKHFLIPLPPLAEQHRIVARVEELMARIDDLEKTETELEKLKAAFPGDMKAALLQAAMQGKLTEQLPEDGDAESLIQSIDYLREKGIREKTIRKTKVNPFFTEDDLPYTVPTNWRWVRFGQVVSNFDGDRKPVAKEKRVKNYGTYPYYGATGIIDVVDDFLFDGEFLMIGEDGGNFFVDRDNSFIARGKFWANNHVHVVKPIAIDIVFLKRFLDSCNLPAMGLINGIAVPKLNQEKMNSIMVPIPPLAEQKRIVEKLDKLLPLCDGLVEE